jgi:hypothetical protein
MPRSTELRRRQSPTKTRQEIEVMNESGQTDSDHASGACYGHRNSNLTRRVARSLEHRKFNASPHPRPTRIPTHSQKHGNLNRFANPRSSPRRQAAHPPKSVHSFSNFGDVRRRYFPILPTRHFSCVDAPGKGKFCTGVRVFVPLSGPLPPANLGCRFNDPNLWRDAP